MTQWGEEEKTKVVGGAADGYQLHTPLSMTPNEIVIFLCPNVLPATPAKCREMHLTLESCCTQFGRK